MQFGGGEISQCRLLPPAFGLVALVAFGGVASSFVASSFVATSFVATSLILGASLFGVAAFGVAASPSAFGFVSAFGMTTSFVAFHSKEDAVGRAEAVEAVGVEERVRFLDAVSTAEVAEDIGVAGRGGAGAETATRSASSTWRGEKTLVIILGRELRGKGRGNVRSAAVCFALE